MHGMQYSRTVTNTTKLFYNIVLIYYCYSTAAWFNRHAHIPIQK